MKNINSFLMAMILSFVFFGAKATQDRNDTIVDNGCTAEFNYWVDEDMNVNFYNHMVWINDPIIDGDSVNFDIPSFDIEFAWSFGDGETSDEANPSHIYSEEGEYEVTLTVTTDDCEDTQTQTVNVETYNWECNAYFYYDYIGDMSLQFFHYGNLIDYDDNDATDNDLTYAWNFGDGNTSDEMMPTHTYEVEGNYNVSLTISNGDDCEDIYSIEIEVETYQYPDECTAEFDYWANENMEVSFYNYMSWGWNSDVNTTEFTWNFGDGETSNEANPVHVYMEEGEYEVTLTVSNGDDCQETSTQTFYIESFNWECDADFYFENIGGLDIQFYVLQYTILEENNYVYSWNFGDGNIYYSQNYDLSIDFLHYSGNWWDDNDTIDTTDLTYFWNFGDGENSNEENPSHTYPEEGFYEVSLTITNGTDCEDTYTVTIEVIDYEYPPIECNAEFYFWVEESMNVYFSSNYVSPFGYSPGEFTWDFGDGNVVTQENILMTNHIYEEEGTYEVTLTIVAEDCETSFTQTVEVENFDWSCQAGFYFYQNSDLSVQFYYAAGNVFDEDSIINNDVNLAWDFGDGETSNELDPVHIYAENGNYQVTLTDATFDYQQIEDIVYFYPMIGMIDWFVDPNLTFTWNFGDGNTSNEMAPSHIYEENGYYEVTFTIEGENCNDTKTVTVYVDENGNPNPYLICGCYFSEESSPLHTFTEDGTYEVCLTVTCDSGYVSTNCETIVIENGANLRAISGTVNHDGYTEEIINSLVLLIESDENGETFEIVDMVETENGLFNFSADADGIYYLYAIPFSGTYLPTYFGDVIFWQDASSINDVNCVDCLYNITLQSFNFEGDFFGDCYIGGNIVNDGGGKSSLENITVVLLNENGEAVAFTTTDANGNFEFTNIPFGNYSVRVEIMGKESQTYNVTLDENNTSDNVEFNISGENVNVVSSEIVNFMINKVYPIPAIEKLNVSLNIENYSNLKFTLTNSLGQEVNSKNVETKKGHLNFEMNVSEIPNGIYFLNITDENNLRTTKKVVINR
ncbi:MAG: hypothetical protein B6I24_05255 [Bacteroidetes bacterium 4572_128]|nr:MAG: hypothetical protein B6I24_05255 [Bacteroidetes bacterium 4572_128]